MLHQYRVQWVHQYLCCAEGKCAGTMIREDGEEIGLLGANFRVIRKVGGGTRVVKRSHMDSCYAESFDSVKLCLTLVSRISEL
jgi:hypothetical protein